MTLIFVLTYKLQFQILNVTMSKIWKHFEVGCHNIIFATFNTNYSGIEDNMVHAGLRKETSNMWNNPIMMSSTSRQVFSLLHPSKFDTFSLPFSSYLATPSSPSPWSTTWLS